MSRSLNSLIKRGLYKGLYSGTTIGVIKRDGLYKGLYSGTTIRVIKRDTRSLDYGSQAYTDQGHQSTECRKVAPTGQPEPE